MEKALPTTIDQYIDGCPELVQPLLHTLRRTIVAAAPQASEKISWGMATFVLHGNLVHFSAEKKHIGFHPAPSAIQAFAHELRGYRCSKGTVQLPYEQPLPLELIGQMVTFRVVEQKRLFAEKQAGKKPTAPAPRPSCEVPADVATALKDAGLRGVYDARPTYQQNGYLDWVAQAKQPTTKKRRMEQFLAELALGTAYMGRPYNGKKGGKETL